MDGKGGIVIADGANFRVMRVSPAGRLSTLAGTGPVGMLDDGDAEERPFPARCSESCTLLSLVGCG